MKYFYSHIIEIDSLLIELDKLDLNQKQKEHLTSLVDSSLHHAILDAIFSKLSDQDKRIFTNHLTVGKDDKIWEFLNNKIEDVEQEIKKAVKGLKDEMHEDISKASLQVKKSKK